MEKAIDALASWPTGIDAVLDAAKQVASGAKPLRWLYSSHRVALQDVGSSASIEPDAESEMPTEAIDEEDERDFEFDLDAKEPIDGLLEFSTNAELLSLLASGASQNSLEWSACRGSLASLGLSRGFLMELADFDLAVKHESALAFVQAMNAYQQARDQMTLANLKLVFSIAKKYLFSGQPLDDLLQEGNIGLIKAVDRYDWRRGFKFSTYATWWIRQQVGRYVADKCRTIRLPVHVYENTQRLAKVGNSLELETGRVPTVDEIAAKMEMPTRKVALLARAIVEPLPIHELDVNDFIAMCANDEFIARDPMDIVSDQQRIRLIANVLASIGPKEQRILRMRFGIGLNDAMTLDEIAIRFELTRERIRQIEGEALRRLKRSMSTGLVLCDFNGNSPPKRDDARSLALEKLLAQVLATGVVINDEREESSGRIWILITETTDNRLRKLVRKLFGMGFEFCPGKGYWK